MDPLTRARLAAAGVAALPALARRSGQRLAGRLTGLPIVTLPDALPDAPLPSP